MSGDARVSGSASVKDTAVLRIPVKTARIDVPAAFNDSTAGSAKDAVTLPVNPKLSLVVY